MQCNPFLTVPEVALVLGRTPSRCYQLVRAGVLPVVRVGGRIVIPRGAFEEWLRQSNERALAALRLPEASPAAAEPVSGGEFPPRRRAKGARK